MSERNYITMADIEEFEKQVKPSKDKTQLFCTKCWEQIPNNRNGRRHKCKLKQ